MRGAMRLGYADLRGRALLVVVGAMMCQLGAGLGYVFGVLQKDIVAELGWTRTMFSAARAPIFLVIALASPIAGAMTVRYGSRPVVVGATLLLGAAYLIVAAMTELWHFYAANVLIGLVVTGLGDVVIGSVVARWVVQARGMALGIVYCGSNLAGVVALPLVAAVAAARGWREAVAALAVSGVCVILPFAALAVRDPIAGEAAGELIAENAKPVVSGGAADLDLRSAVATRSFWILAALLFAFFFYFIAMLEHTVPHLTDIGFSRVEAAAAFGFAIGLGVWSKLGAGVIADRMRGRTALAIDFALLALSSVLIVFADLPGVLTAFLFAFGIAVAARDVLYPLIVAECFGVAYLAQIYGALMLALLPGGALGPIFAAAVFDRSGSYRGAFALFALLNATALIAVAFLRDERTA